MKLVFVPGRSGEELGSRFSYDFVRFSPLKNPAGYFLVLEFNDVAYFFKPCLKSAYFGKTNVTFSEHTFLNTF